MASENFYDFKYLSTKVRNLDTDNQGSKIRWLEIKKISLHSEFSDTAQYDYNKPCVYLNLQPSLRNKDKQLPDLNHNFRHGNSPKVSQSKYEDLKILCDQNIIPQPYHSFYKSLPWE